MIRKKRGYTRDTSKELLRDYKLFAIACEGGKKEPQYFKLFEHISNRIKVDIIEDKVQDEELYHKYETKSAPKWVLDRAIKYIEQEGLIDEDELWFVMDVDRWEEKQIYEIIGYCKDSKNWNIVLSNPCFEVWLYLHKNQNFNNSEAESCKELKKEVSDLDSGGYHPLKYITLIKDAANNARKLDENSNKNVFPKVSNSTIYNLIDSIFEFISEKQFEEFCEETFPKLIEKNKLKIEKSKVRIKIK